VVIDDGEYTSREAEGREMARVSLPGWKCERCGHVWVSRQQWTDEPRVCPKCKSPYWNRPRQKSKRKASGKKE
jgi:predicted Zn-ribbon and HTH transcriptional regulator